MRSNVWSLTIPAIPYQVNAGVAEARNHMLIREAQTADAAQACEVMRRSIAELCGCDHRGDPVIVGRWLANKRPDIVRSWIEDSGSRMFVAVEGDVVLAVGAVENDGEITLNYVSPDVRFRGVSRTMLAQLERAAREAGNADVRLTSTETARRFYLSAGYEEIGPPEGKFGTSSSYPMRKRLV